MAASKGRGRQAGGAREQRAGGAASTGGGGNTANGADKLKVNIPSDYNAGFNVQQQILDAAARHGFNEHCVYAIKMAVEEALVNAIKHGNGGDPTKRVKIEAAISTNLAEISIEDEGPGFDRSVVPDPLADENLEKPSGRGILLIESYMSQVIWDHGGRRVRMIKHGDDKGPGCTAG